MIRRFNPGCARAWHVEPSDPVGGVVGAPGVGSVSGGLPVAGPHDHASVARIPEIGEVSTWRVTTVFTNRNAAQAPAYDRAESAGEVDSPARLRASVAHIGGGPAWDAWNRRRPTYPTPRGGWWAVTEPRSGGREVAGRCQLARQARWCRAVPYRVAIGFPIEGKARLSVCSRAR